MKTSMEKIFTKTDDIELIESNSFINAIINFGKYKNILDDKSYIKKRQFNSICEVLLVKEIIIYNNNNLIKKYPSGFVTEDFIFIPEDLSVELLDDYVFNSQSFNTFDYLLFNYGISLISANTGVLFNLNEFESVFKLKNENSDYEHQFNVAILSNDELLIELQNKNIDFREIKEKIQNKDPSLVINLIFDNIEEEKKTPIKKCFKHINRKDSLIKINEYLENEKLISFIKHEIFFKVNENKIKSEIFFDSLVEIRDKMVYLNDINFFYLLEYFRFLLDKIYDNSPDNKLIMELAHFFNNNDGITPNKRQLLISTLSGYSIINDSEIIKEPDEE